MHFLQVETSAPRVRVPLFVIAVIFQAFYQSLKTSVDEYFETKGIKKNKCACP